MDPFLLYSDEELTNRGMNFTTDDFVILRTTVDVNAFFAPSRLFLSQSVPRKLEVIAPTYIDCKPLNGNTKDGKTCLPSSLPKRRRKFLPVSQTFRVGPLSKECSKSD
jgi:hypothetical protein